MSLALPLHIIPNWHAVIVHFPVALLITAAALGVASRLFSNSSFGSDLYKVARWNLWLGTIAAVFAVVTGLHAYQTVNHDPAGHLAMTVHMRWAFLTLSLSLLVAIITIFGRYSNNRPGLIITALLLSVGLSISVTGYLGGENVYRHGLGVMHMPAMEEDEESADHNHHNH